MSASMSNSCKQTELERLQARLADLEDAIGINAKTLSDMENGKAGRPIIMASLYMVGKHLREYHRIQAAAIAEVQQEQRPKAKMYLMKNK